jgi:hypothetical protein
VIWKFNSLEANFACIQNVKNFLSKSSEKYFKHWFEYNTWKHRIGLFKHQLSRDRFFHCLYTISVPFVGEKFSLFFFAFRCNFWKWAAFVFMFFFSHLSFSFGGCGWIYRVSFQVWTEKRSPNFFMPCNESSDECMWVIKGIRQQPRHTFTPLKLFHEVSFFISACWSNNVNIHVRKLIHGMRWAAAVRWLMRAL